VDSCDRLRAEGRNAVRIEMGLHSDTFLLNETYDAISVQLARWLGR
jgi:hypothetical protein